MKIAIVGAGIGGIATAAFLRRAGLDAVVYEQASRLAEVGAGIILAPNAVRLLRRLGLEDQLAERAVRVETGWEFRRWENGAVLLAQDMSRCADLYGESAWSIHRADLLEMLVGCVPPGVIHLGQRVERVDQDDAGVELRFQGGNVHRADLLIAADGIHSVVRRGFATQEPPRAVGLVAWRALIPSVEAGEFARRPAQTLWVGPGRHLVHYPVSGGEKINLVAFTPSDASAVESWTAEGDPDDFRAEFAGWDDRLLGLLRSVSAVGRWAVMDRQPIDNYHFGRIALLGDAAHPMLPFFAQGAGQAIEDAATIAVCLAQADGEVNAALASYNALRVPRTTRVQEASYGRAEVNHLPDGERQRARDAGYASEDPLNHSAWLYSHDPEGAARDYLRSSAPTR